MSTMKTLLILAAALALAGNASAANESTHLAGHADKAPGPPGYTTVRDNDKAMQRAVAHARGSFGFFLAALRAKKPGDRSFEIKTAFSDDRHVEHLWVGNLRFDGQNFQGQIDNAPHDIDSVHLGQSVTIAPRKATDWMFVKNGKLFGGYTTRVLYARLSHRDRARFDKEADFNIR